MPDPRADTERSGDPGPRDPDADGPTHLLDADFEYASERRARVVADSIRVEVGEMPDERSGATVDREGRVVSVEIGAADLVALRAGINTWVRLVNVAEDVAAACDGRVASGVGNGRGSTGGDRADASTHGDPPTDQSRE